MNPHFFTAPFLLTGKGYGWMVAPLSAASAIPPDL